MDNDSVSSRCLTVPSVSNSEIIEPPPLRRGQSNDRPRSFAESQSVFTKDVVIIVPHPEPRADPPAARRSALPSYKNNNINNNSADDTTTLPVLPVPHVARSAMTAYKANLYAIPSFAIKDIFGCNAATAADKVLKSDASDSMDCNSVTNETNWNQQQKRQIHHQVSQEEGHNHGFEVTLVNGEEEEALKSKSTDLLDDGVDDSDDDDDDSESSGPLVVGDSTSVPPSGEDEPVVCDENNKDEALDASSKPEKPSPRENQLDMVPREQSKNVIVPDYNCRLLNKTPKHDLSLDDERYAASPYSHCEALIALLVAAVDSPKSSNHGKADANRALLSDVKQGERDDTGPDVAEVSSNPKDGMLSRDEARGGGESPLESERSDRSLQTTPTGVTRKQENVENFSMKWTRLVSKVHRPVLLVLQTLSQLAVRNPIRTIVYITTLSVALAAIGLVTNFTYTVDETIMWTPFGTPTESQRDWIEAEWGASQGVRPFVVFLHGEGRNILGQNPVAHLFEALDLIRNLDGYDDVCKMSSYVGPDGKNACKIHGAVQFWNSSTSIFEQQVTSDEDAILTMSADRYPNNVPVYAYEIFGYPQRNATNNLLTSVVSYTVMVNFPFIEESKALEEDALDVILQLRDTWAADPTNFLRLEAAAQRTFSDEFTRAIVDDLYLLPIVFVMLSAFTAFAFSRWHKVYSRSLLGIGAVITCLLSITTAYGLLMICGIPVTTATQMLPFVVMGIGLDDAFIIMGSFTRKDTKDIAEHMRQTIEDIGVSIFLTSLTSSLAFALGCFSNVPTIYWMSLYAFPMIIIDFIYQITFFVALLVLDERRIQQNRRDVCTWITVPSNRPQGKRIASASVRNSSEHDIALQNPGETVSCAIENTAKENSIIAPNSPREDEGCDQSSQAATMGHFENEQAPPHDAQRLENEVEKNTNFEAQLFENEQVTNAAMSSHSSYEEAQQSVNEDMGAASSHSYEAQGLLSRLRNARVKKQAVNVASMSQSSEAHRSENDQLPPIAAENSRSYEMQQPENETSSLPSNEMQQIDDSPMRSTSSDMLATVSSVSKDRKAHFADRLMERYGEYLLRPWVKAFVILGFCLLAAFGALSASKLTQKFEFTDLMPDDSYAIDFFDAVESYSLQATVSPYVYFRDVDQSDQVIQQQMGEYVVDLVLGVDAIVLGPNAFWLRDFRDYVDFAGIQDLDFNAQLDQFLNVPVLFEMYNGDIIRDENGTLISSRCMVSMLNMPKVDNLQESIDALHQQRAVTMEQPVNNGNPDGPFFTYGEPYNIWEFFAVCVNELTLTVVMGVVAVSIISIFFVPHWTAVFYVTPLVCVLNVELLGVLQWAGMHVDAITYITVFMAIGIFVDYIMHVLIRYYESAGNRRDKTLEMLRTMGTSILLGGLSTLLGTVPLVFSSSGIFYTVFVTAFGIVLLGMGHGLILLPVLLSIFGTEEQVIIHSVTQIIEDGMDKSSRGIGDCQPSVSGHSSAESDGVNGSGGTAKYHERMGAAGTVEINKENGVDPPSTANTKSGRATPRIDPPTAT